MAFAEIKIQLLFWNKGVRGLYLPSIAANTETFDTTAKPMYSNSQ